ESSVAFIGKGSESIYVPSLCASKQQLSQARVHRVSVTVNVGVVERNAMPAERGMRGNLARRKRDRLGRKASRGRWERSLVNPVSWACWLRSDPFPYTG